MNKNAINIFVLSAAALAFAGCSDDFLNVESKTELNSGTAYNTQTQAQYAVVGCYDGFQRTVSKGSWPTLFQAVETMSDDCLGGGAPDDRSDRLMDRFDMSYKSDAVDLFEGIWKDYYFGIYRCNLLLSKVDGIAFTSDSIKAQVVAETRGLRGAEYFDMVRMFENIPLVTTPSDSIVAQAPKDAVYQQIVEDLTYAAENIGRNVYTDNSSSMGRMNQYAAKALLARLYLFYDGVYNNNQGGQVPGGLTKAKALQYCEDIIASGFYSLEPAFKNLWPAACTEATTPEVGRKSTYNEGSQENIWVMKFNNDQTYEDGSPQNGNLFIRNLGMRNAKAQYAPYGDGYGACPITPYANSLFDSDDTRGGATVINCRNVASENEKTAYDDQSKSDIMDYTGYVNMKYCPVVFTDGTLMQIHESTATSPHINLSNDQNWVIVRYADVLLMAAELGSPNAVAYFNKVRERAYGDASHNIESTPTLKQIWDERRKEFMGEGIRYWDLLRQGMDAFVSAQMGQATNSGTTLGMPIKVFNNTAEETISDTYKENNIRSKRGFFQIPAHQITLSGGVYKQNAGW